MRGLAGGAHRHGRQGRADDGAVGVELHLSLDWGANAGEVGATVQARVGGAASLGWQTLGPRASTWSWTRWHSASSDSTGATLEHAPVRLPRVRLVAVAQRGTAAKERWCGRPRTSGARGERSTATTTDACSARSSTALRPLPACGRAAAGPPSDDAVLVTCVYLVSPRRRGSSSRCSSPRSARRATRARGRSRRSRTATPRGVDLRALPRPPHRLPARLPRRLRLPAGARPGARRAAPARARRAHPVAEGKREACSGWSRRPSRRRPCRSGRE